MNKRKTIIDVARECGLSQATVARVLNGQQDIQVKEKTRQRVMSAAQKIG
ncbi:MAG: LacI family DNA-binding transcriptional regulator, partial [Pseudomonadota bacterium]|nr:LacI family DNA-binding transcriptional regulator [Pseudomonadota bacterium]